MKESIIEFIKNEISNKRLETINGDDMLFDLGILDSLGIMRLIGFIEDRSQIKVPFQDLTIENFSTVDRIVAYMSRHRV
ncbi:acyl carrier protein [Arenibacter sp. BSSL-BM3]|uniref:Acyl carrier protein n=1 Tax=Arenibacter arenosicollis TaxID=2762274 RepID=A0ABR7QS54_9FLAO|nr:acyl carrier protein [Arenibacter arenosicollis]MBC8769909.1 acyl carrier protein [Arenibacter arenosicollis]